MKGRACDAGRYTWQVEAAWVDGALAASLTPLVPVGTDEAPTIAWVDPAVHRTARAAALCARFGPRYTCACAKCDWEAEEARARNCRTRWLFGSVDAEADARSAGCRPWLRLARAALEDGRFEACVTLLHAAIDEATTSSPTTSTLSSTLGELWHALGSAHLSAGDYAAAQDAWARGAVAAPTFAPLSAIAAKAAKYTPYVPSAEPRAELAPPISLLGGRIARTHAPLLSPGECAAAIRAAEAHAAADGGWTSTRHHAVPTTDLPIDAVPELLSWFNVFFTSQLGPLLSKHFDLRRFVRADAKAYADGGGGGGGGGGGDGGGDGDGGGYALRVHDAFIVRYRAGAQALTSASRPPF